jgi:membrane-associated protease RseP (regulator of RpoE activity)
MNGYLIALIVLSAYLFLVYFLRRTKWLERHNMSLMGPIIMWRTRKGRELIDRIASKKRFWNAYGQVALWICAGSMLLIMTLLIWEATIVPQVKKAPSPELILGIPGINPVIPLGYGVLALVVAIVVHEMSHGILTRVGQMKVQSLGLLFLVFPIGAFVEPDEKELQSTTRSRRSKVFAVGPASNIVLALVMLLLFSGVMMSSVEPSRDGALAVGVVDGSPIQRAGVSPTSVIVSVGGMEIKDATDLENRASSSPGSTVEVRYYYKGELVRANVTDGVVVAYIVKDFAADKAGLETGMVLIKVNDSNVTNVDALSDIMAVTHASQIVNISVMSYSSSAGRFVLNTSVSRITLSDKWAYYDKYDPNNNKETYRGVGYLGGGFLNLGVRNENVSYYSGVLSNPFGEDKNLNDFSRSWLRLIALPFLDLAPLRSPVTDLYHPAGGLAWMPDSAFWLLTNSLYWIFWLNLMVGLTNVLPAVPLDGGYIFRDALDYLLEKTGRTYSKEQKDQIVSVVTLTIALFVLSLIVWQLVGPAL